MEAGFHQFGGECLLTEQLLPSLRGHVAQPRFVYQINPTMPRNINTAPMTGHVGHTKVKETPAKSRRGMPQHKRCRTVKRMKLAVEGLSCSSCWSTMCFLSILWLDLMSKKCLPRFISYLFLWSQVLFTCAVSHFMGLPELIQVEDRTLLARFVRRIFYVAPHHAGLACQGCSSPRTVSMGSS
jgi:hypothetical protein